MKTERRAYRITGQVQGVGYRYFSRHEADSLQIKGWVCNHADGSVEIQVEGASDKLNTFESRLRQGPSSGQVKDLVRIDADTQEGFGDFEIRFG